MMVQNTERFTTIAAPGGMATDAALDALSYEPGDNETIVHIRRWTDDSPSILGSCVTIEDVADRRGNFFFSGDVASVFVWRAIALCSLPDGHYRTVDLKEICAALARTGRIDDVRWEHSSSKGIRTIDGWALCQEVLADG